LQVLTSVLLDHILYISAPPTPRFAVLESLLPHLVTLTISYPAQSAQYFVAKISIMHKNLVRGLSHGSLDPKAKIWPGLPELLLLRVIGSLWPTSDMRHAVISPTRLLMGAYLGLGRVRSLSDVASGLFLCTLFLQYEALSKRLVPEAINFLVNAVLHLAPHRFKDVAALPGCFPAPDFQSDLCRPLMLNAKQARDAVVQKADLVVALGDRTLDEQTKLDLLGLTVELLKRFADTYKSLPGFIELYEPIDAVLRGVESEKLPLAYQVSTRSAHYSIQIS
jgi:nucleolar protein 14